MVTSFSTLLVGLNENERALISKRLFQEFPQDIPKLLFVYFGNHSCSYQKDPGQTKSSNGEGQNQKSLCCFFLRNNLYHRRTIPNSTSSYIKTVSFDDLHNGWVRYFKQWTDDPYGLIVFILMLFRTNQKLNLDAVGVVDYKFGNDTLVSLKIDYNIFNLSTSPLGSKGVEKIAEVLNNNILTSLHLSNVDLGPEGGKALANALYTNSTLTSLDLGTGGKKNYYVVWVIDLGLKEERHWQVLFARTKQLPPLTFQEFKLVLMVQKLFVKSFEPWIE
ncbi:hypothetical protein C2G38_2256809 [Gigaspora rosea]|uniref:Uncharacterized protein n=1 Tax=Gigaspora rosea TaxID=44941 RepID=A0A397TZG5_9GLOM|nr:hypothetical protein C2G38_2256809 [Gigaspora rosea]